jgi:thioredoxin 2
MRGREVSAHARVDQNGVIVACGQCGSSNRLRFNVLAKTTRCGNCHAALGAPANPVEIPDAATFDAAANHSALPLIVDFWAPWCGPCKMVAPELERVAQANAGHYLVVKVNTDVVTDVAARFAIRSIPTLAVVFGGRELARVAGVRPASEIEAFAARTLAAATPRAS